MLSPYKRLRKQLSASRPGRYLKRQQYRFSKDKNLRACYRSPNPKECARKIMERLKHQDAFLRTPEARAFTTRQSIERSCDRVRDRAACIARLSSQIQMK